MITNSDLKQSSFTKSFIEEAKLPAHLVADFKYKIWVDPTNENSLRLNRTGFIFLTKHLGFKHWEFSFSEPLVNRNLLQLGKLFPSIYYLGDQFKITVFDEQEATMLTLHDGDLTAYLNHLAKVSGYN